jgi:hypothetical protein
LDRRVFHNSFYQQYDSGQRNLSVSILGNCVLRFGVALEFVSMPALQKAVLQTERLERQSASWKVSAQWNKEMDKW